MIGCEVVLKKIVKDLVSVYQQHSFVCCGKLIEPELVDETTFKKGTHNGRYDDDKSQWFPHYDIEFKCYNCRYYEHYTHDPDGAIIAMTIMNVIFDFTDDTFGIIRNGKIIPAGSLPNHIDYDSEDFQIYFQKVLGKANP